MIWEDVSQEELALALEVFQTSTFPSWGQKLTAARFQRRLDEALKAGVALSQAAQPPTTNNSKGDHDEPSD